MELSVLNWNIGGAKILEQKRKSDRAAIHKELNTALRQLLHQHKPDVVALQEIVRYKNQGDKRIVDLIDPIKGYEYFPFTLIDSLVFSSQAKWHEVKLKSDWSEDAYFAQGNAMLFKKGARLFPLWDLSKLNEKSPGRQRSEAEKHFGGLTRLEKRKRLIEHVHLNSGLYFGDRNTEPRAALVSHLIEIPDPDRPMKRQKPLDIFVVNVHLVTIMKERVGITHYDSLASRERMGQLRVVFDEIISRYNSWADDGFPQRGKKRKPKSWETIKRHKPVWILCGDFNFTEESVEYEFIKRLNFIDTTPAAGRISPRGKGTKTSGAGKSPRLTLDYIFVGPKFITFDPAFEETHINQNRVDHGVLASDHYPVLSKIPLSFP